MTVIRRLTRGIRLCTILVLPIGIYQGDSDSNDFVIGVASGTGQYASVVRGCEGPVAARGSRFADVGGQVALRVPPGGRSALIVGVRGGYFRTDYRSIYSIYDYEQQGRFIREGEAYPYSFSYVNPSLSIETKDIGIGIGFLTGSRVLDFSHGLGMYSAPPDYDADVSGHIRLGNPRSAFFITNLNENVPLVSGGSFFDLGFGLGSKRGRVLFLGISGKGVYDSPGLLGQVEFPIEKRLSIAGALRCGAVSDVAEAAFSFGLVYSLSQNHHSP